MRKKISCKVINSVALNRANHKTCPRPLQPREVSKIKNEASAIYLDLSDTSKKPLETNLTGQIFDCYA